MGPKLGPTAQTGLTFVAGSSFALDYRPHCVQIIIALVVTPEGLPLAYEVLPGNTADKSKHSASGPT